MQNKSGFHKFLKLNFSQCISLIGSGLTDFALFYYILQNVMKSSEQISQYTILYFMMYFPGMMVAPFIGTFVDRYNKKYILIISDTIAAIGSLFILLIYMNNSLELYHVYIVVLAKSVASAFQAPTFQSSVSVLVEEKDYGRAVGLAQVGESINKIISPLLAGMLFYYTSLEMIIVIDLICYLFALIVVAPIKMPQVQCKNEKTDNQFLKDCQLGFKLLAKDKMLISLLILFMFNNFFISFIQILVQPLVYVMNEQGTKLISNSLALGIVMTCGGVGMMISSIAMGIKGQPRNSIGTILILNGCGGFILMIVIAVKSVGLFALGTLAYFLTIPFILGSNLILWQIRVPVEHQGKVFSLRRACVLGIIPLSSLIVGAIVDGINKYYDHLYFLHGIIKSPNEIYKFLFFIIGGITVIISVIFTFNRQFKGYQNEWKRGLDNG
jgi:DHA3 family macrolide efflux protein-like MFS transporter